MVEFCRQPEALMAANSEESKRGVGSFNLFSSSSQDENAKTQFGFGFFDAVENPLPPPPPCIEVLPSQVSSSVNFTVEPVNVDGVNLVKGRVSTREVFALSNLDLIPGKYEGGLKLWEGSLDLIKALRSETQKAQLSFPGKRVLELGCGHGLPGIFAGLEGAASVHFQDFNSEVLQCLTIPNVSENLLNRAKTLGSNGTKHNKDAEFRYFAGDWSEVHQLFPPIGKDESCDIDHNANAGYDIILMAETVYSISALGNLYKLIKMCGHPRGVVYVAGKKHYFGVGGGTRSFLSVVEKDGSFTSNLVLEVADGSSNVREVWKLSPK